MGTSSNLSSQLTLAADFQQSAAKTGSRWRPEDGAKHIAGFFLRGNRRYKEEEEEGVEREGAARRQEGKRERRMSIRVTISISGI